jgi:hypothetical protein
LSFHVHIDEAVNLWAGIKGVSVEIFSGATFSISCFKILKNNAHLQSKAQWVFS